MAIEKKIKVPRGYGRQPIINFQEISKGVSPAIEDEQAANYLPVLQASKLQDEWMVVLAGTIVGRDSNGYLVPCNGNEASVDLVYSVNDVGYTVDIEDTTELVTAAKTATDEFPQTLPIGWASYHWFTGSVRDRHQNYDLQPNVSTLNDYLVQVPLLWDEQFGGGSDPLVNGCLVKPHFSATVMKKNGAPIYFDPAADSVDLVSGRVLKVGNIRAKGGLEKVRTLAGSGISGDGTGGIEHWLVATREDGTTASNKQAYIAIDFM